MWDCSFLSPLFIQVFLHPWYHKNPYVALMATNHLVVTNLKNWLKYRFRLLRFILDWIYVGHSACVKLFHVISALARLQYCLSQLMHRRSIYGKNVHQYNRYNCYTVHAWHSYSSIYSDTFNTVMLLKNVYERENETVKIFERRARTLRLKIIFHFQ